MPTKGDTRVNSFVKGLITEANPINWPVDASVDELNMDMSRNGSRKRRLGLDYEDNYVLHPTGLTADQIEQSLQRVYVWPTPSGFNEVKIGVVQIGTTLFFINLFAGAPSSDVLNGGNGLDASAVSSIIDNNTLFDFAIINNNLVVVSEGLNTPFLLSYDYPTDTISYETAPVEIRDLYGVEDDLAVDERPSTLTHAHLYNLRNQGWDSSIVTTCGTDVVECTKSGIGVYPSNSDTWSLGKIADVTSADIDKFDPDTFKRNSFDIGRAAKGHYIIDLYKRGNSRSEVSGLLIADSDIEEGRISTVASMGGRLFYSGIRSRVVNPGKSPKLSGTVLFSQVGRNNEDLVKCYQEADPTSPNNSDIVDTDGGVIQITECAEILEIRNIKGSILVFAVNGVWEIRGDDGGFRATSFQVNKVSTVGVLGRESIVEANGTIFFWGANGIYTLTRNQLDTGYDTVNITLDKIQNAYNTLPAFNKGQAKGYFDEARNRVRWLFYNDKDTSSEGGVGVTDPDPDPEVIPPDISSAVEIDLGFPPLTLDCEILSDTEFVVAAVVRDPGSGNDYIYANLSTLDDSEGVAFTPGSAVAIDTSFTDWAFGDKEKEMSVSKLDDGKFVILAKRDTTPQKLYSIVCTVSGGVITPHTPEEVVDPDLLGTLSDIVSINDLGEKNTIWFGYRSRTQITSTAGTQTNPIHVRKMTYSGDSIALVGSANIVWETISAYDIDYSKWDDSETYTFSGYDQTLTNTSHIGRYDVSSGGFGLLETIQTNNLGLYTGTLLMALTSAGAYAAAAAQNITSGTKLAFADMNTGVKLDDIVTTNTDAHSSLDIEGVRTSINNRVFVIYGADTPSVDMETFTFDGNTATSASVYTIETANVISIRISQDSFTATKSPFAYINEDGASNVAKAVVMEVGTGETHL